MRYSNKMCTVFIKLGKDGIYMIYDKIEHIKEYKGLSKHLDTAIDFLMSTDLKSLPMGKTFIDGEKVFINIMEATSKGEEGIAFEIHKKYMDIQIDIEGKEIIQIGERTTKEIQPYQDSIDFGTVECKKIAECVMGKDKFIICMKEEPHKPGVQADRNIYLKKCVVKVAVE